MAQQNRDYSALVAESAAAIIDRLTDRLAEVTRLTQQILIRDIAELPGDAQLQQLLRDNVAANIDTTFSRSATTSRSTASSRRLRHWNTRGGWRSAKCQPQR